MTRQHRLTDSKPLVGVSACLLGQKVRYDGHDKKNSFIVDVLSQACHFLPICPEAGAGLGIPRPPVQLVGNLDHSRALGKHDSNLDVTEQLEQFSLAQGKILNKLSGFIFKSRSPSCGLIDTPIFRTGNPDEFQTGPGIFARILTQNFPTLPVCDENMLKNPAFVQNFLERVKAKHDSISKD